MSLFKKAQNVDLNLADELFVDEQDLRGPMTSSVITINEDDLNPIEVEEGQGGAGVVVELEEGEEPEVFSFSLPNLPGSEDPNLEIEIEEPETEEVVIEEEQDPFSWGKDIKNFMPWLQKMWQNIPKHQGQYVGLVRAKAYLELLHNSLLKALKQDLKGELDAKEVHGIQTEIKKGMDRLETAIAKLEKANKKKASATGMVKEAQKILGVNGITITVPLLISTIARTCINGMVSGGHDIEWMVTEQIKKYALDVREQTELVQLITDMGYAVRRDRGFTLDEKVDTTSSDNFDWNANYPA